MSTRAGLIFTVLLLITAGVPAQSTDKDLDKFQGDWTLVSVEVAGKNLPDESKKQFKLTIKGDQWTFTIDGKEAMAATIKIDPSKDPKTIDLTSPDKKMLRLGIYKLEGDTLTVCHARSDLGRPKEFKTEDKMPGQRNEVWKRAKK